MDPNGSTHRKSIGKLFSSFQLQHMSPKVPPSFFEAPFGMLPQRCTASVNSLPCARSCGSKSTARLPTWQAQAPAGF